jgi:lipopolysaccharide export system protein LptA
MTPTRVGPARTGSARTGSARTGLILALVVGAIFASIVGIALVRGTSTPPAQPEAPDITQIPGQTPAPGQATSAAGGLVTTSGAVIQLTDKRDPGRIAGIIRAAKLEPLEARRYLIEKPRVWYDLKDGRRLWVAADEGRLFMPDRGGRSEPENGTLRGNVTIKLFDRLPAGAPDLDPERDSAAMRALTLLTATTDSINFDGALGEVSTPDRLVVTSDRIDFAGTGLRVILSEAQDRIDLLQVQKREYIRYRLASNATSTSAAATPNAAASPAASTSAAANTTGTSADAAPSAQTVLYRAQFTDEVRVTMGERLLTADRLDVLVRLINGRLPGRTAAAGTNPAPTTTSNTSTSNTSTSNTTASAAQSSGTSSQASSASAEPELLELLGTGGIELRPIASADPVPAELTGDDLALRFSGERSGRVRVTDPALGLEAQAASILYRATSQELALEGVGPASVDVLLRGKGSGAAPARAALVNYRINLASGLSHAAGPGVLELLPAGADPAQTPVGSADRRLSWNDQAEFDFETVNGRTTGRLKEARLTGAVEARDGGGTSGTGAGSSVKGGFLQAMLEPGGEREALRIRRLVAREAAEFADGRGGLLRGETLDVAFTTRTGLTGAPVTDPTDIQATGKVVAQRGSGPTLARLETDALRALLDRRTTDDQGKMLPGEGELVVTQMDASGKVRYVGGDGITFAGDKAQAEPAAQRLRLTGNANLGVSQGDAGTIVTGDDLTLDGITRRLEVAGQGTFEHADKRSDSSRGPIVASATWKDRMTYDDTTGVVLAEGRAIANSLSAGKSRERLKAQQVRVELTPYAAPAAGGTAEPRKLLRMIATGTDAAPAEVEQRVLEAIGPEIRPDAGLAAMGAGASDDYARLVFVRSREITADDAAGTITAPGSGTMLIVDRRQIERDTQTLEPNFTGSGRGNTLFRWTQGLTATRADGRIVMAGDVSMTHERLPDGQLTLLEAERLTARLRELASDGVRTTQRDARAELLDVEAQGRVYARSGSKELTAERMLYDAQGEQVDVFSAPGTRVTVFDGQRATPVSAERLRWNLRSDTVEVLAPGTISTPR